MTGRGTGNRMGLAVACLAGAIAFSCAAGADEITTIVKAPGRSGEITIDSGPMHAIKAAAASIVAAASRAKDQQAEITVDTAPTGALGAMAEASARAVAARPAADQAEAPFRPELPPDDAGQPVVALPSPAPAAAAPDHPRSAAKIAK